MFYLLFCFKGISTEVAQTITIESFRTQARSVGENGQTESVPFSKALVEIYYYDLNGEKCSIKNVETDASGYIRNIPLEIPDLIQRNQIFFRYVLKNDKYGNLVNSGGVQYRAITSAFIPVNKILNIDTTREFPNAVFMSNAAKTWELFVSTVDEVQSSVKYAEENSSFKMRADFEFKPISVQYEYGMDLSNSFNIAIRDIGSIQNGSPFISINDADAGARLINLAHEWSHWVMYSALNGFNTGDGKYSGHYTYTDPRVSWKEGWALAQSNLLTTALGGWTYSSYQFGRKQFDTSPQDHNVIGKSTLSTVNGVIIDIFDKDYTYKGLEGVNEEEFYDLASDHSKLTSAFDTERAIKEGKLANGLMTVAMVNSKATRLSDYIQYLKTSGMVKNVNDFEAMLYLNGLDTNGRFILDNNGNRIIY